MRAWRPTAVVAGICAGVAYLVQIIVSKELPPWLVWILSVAGSILLLISVALPIFQAGREAKARQTAEQLAREAESAHNTKMHDVLIPLSVALGDVIKASTSRERTSAQQRFTQAVVDVASENVGPRRTRACYFDHQEGPPRRLVISIWRGRSGGPRQYFEAGTDAGNEALRVLDSGEANLVKDADAEQPPGWPPQGRDCDYRTYIQMGVILGDRKIGLLTVDAIKPGSLDDEDKLLVRLLAQHLACALGVNAK